MTAETKQAKRPMPIQKQLFKRGFFDQHARTYYFKVAHNSNGKYVLFELMKSLGKSSVGSGIITIKSRGATIWD